MKKHTLNPEITILYHFHAQKALFKVPKICNINFWIENDLPPPAPPPLEIFQKIIRFGSGTLPLIADVEVAVGESLEQLSAWQQLVNSIFIIYGEIDDMELGDNLFVACCRYVSGYFGVNSGVCCDFGRVAALS